MDVSEATFFQDVIEPSYGSPVIVDFYATWCGPCQILKPLLEKLTAEYGVGLAKVDIDQNPELASRYHVQGVPDVRVAREGNLHAGFVGALPEPQLREFLAGLATQFELDTELAQVQSAIAAGDYAAAKAQFDLLFKKYPPDARIFQQPKIVIAAVEFLLQLEKFEDAARLLATIPPSHTPEFAQAQALKAKITFHQAAQMSGDGSPVARQFQRSAQAALEEDYAAALQGFLEIVERDRGFKEDGARKAMLSLFTLLGADHPLTQEYQQALMMVLY